MSKKLLVLGANGLLGRSVCPVFERYSFDVMRQDRTPENSYSTDLLDCKQVRHLVNKTMPDIVCNFAALANVDACEVPQRAYESNVKIVMNIVNELKNQHSDAYLIQISTDNVYDGKDYQTEDDVQLKNYYAFSKFSGELATASFSSSSLRTNFFGKGVGAKSSFTDWLYESLLEETPIRVFDDVFFNPLSMTTLAENLVRVANNQPKGVFNLGSRNGMSKSEFTFAFAEELGLPVKNIISMSINDVDFIKTYRPRDMRMNVCKIEDALGVAMPTLKDEIILAAKEYK